jgi:hypothetical protein
MFQIAMPARRPTSILTLIALTLAAITLARPSVAAQGRCAYWVAPPPAGDDSHDGSALSPWATLAHAAAHAEDNSCTIWVKDGAYYGEHRIDRRFETPTTFRAVHAYQAVLENEETTVNINGGRNLIFEGFVFRHAGPRAGELVVSVHSDDGQVWAEEIVFRNNIFHDSYNDDLLKLYNGVRSAVVEGNVFYNQGAGEQQMDVNSVVDVTIRENIFFNDYEGSGREPPYDIKHFIIIKDSGGPRDGVLGSQRVTVEANIFLNWHGKGSFFVKVGNDSQPFHEGLDIRVANNLFVGNATDVTAAPFGASGGKGIVFVNNTVTGDMPATAYAFALTTKGANPQNEDIQFRNNIWSDPTGTMGQGEPGDPPLFSSGTAEETSGLLLQSNLYWNGGRPIPDGTQATPGEDPEAIVADPQLPPSGEVVLPRWNGERFASGNRTIRQEFLRLARQYARLPATSPAIGEADPTVAPSHDLLGRPRTATPDLGAYEYQPALRGSVAGGRVQLEWDDPRESEAAVITLTYSSAADSGAIRLPPEARSHLLAGLSPFSVYQVQLSVHDDAGAVLASSNVVVVITGSSHLFVSPLLFALSDGS